MPTTSSTTAGSTTSTIDAALVDAIGRMMGDATATASSVTAPEQPVKEFELPAGKVKYTDLFGATFTGREHGVTQYKAEDWAEEVRGFIPKRNPAYVFQPEATEMLVLALEEGDKTLFTGPTGSGKSSLVQQVCAVLNRPFIRINMTGDMESSVFFGSMTVEDNATVWKDGPITEAVKFGAVCLVDEWELSPPEIMMGLQWLLEDAGVLYLKEKPGASTEKLMVPHDDFRIVMGGNTLGLGDETGSHSGVNVQNTATLDRFQTVIKLDYLDTKHEIKMLTESVEGLNKNIAKQMVQFASVLRTAYKQGNVSLTMSPRTLINWGRKTVYWGDPVLALKIAFFSKIPDSEKDTVNKLVNKVFAVTI